jgi:hypothetical protein
MILFDGTCEVISKNEPYENEYGETIQPLSNRKVTLNIAALGNPNSTLVIQNIWVKDKNGNGGYYLHESALLSPNSTNLLFLERFILPEMDMLAEDDDRVFETFFKDWIWKIQKFLESKSLDYKFYDVLEKVKRL